MHFNAGYGVLMVHRIHLCYWWRLIPRLQLNFSSKERPNSDPQRPNRKYFYSQKCTVQIFDFFSDQCVGTVKPLKSSISFQLFLTWMMNLMFRYSYDSNLFHQCSSWKKFIYNGILYTTSDSVCFLRPSFNILKMLRDCYLFCFFSSPQPMSFHKHGFDFLLQYLKSKLPVSAGLFRSWTLYLFSPRLSSDNLECQNVFSNDKCFFGTHSFQVLRVWLYSLILQSPISKSTNSSATVEISQSKKCRKTFILDYSRFFKQCYSKTFDLTFSFKVFL